MKKRTTLFALLTTVSITAWAQQQDTLTDPSVPRSELEEIVIRGNRLETPFNKVTRDIQLITQKQLEALPAKSLNGVLSYISGVDIRQRGPFGAQADISIDGGNFRANLSAY